MRHPVLFGISCFFLAIALVLAGIALVSFVDISNMEGDSLGDALAAVTVGIVLVALPLTASAAVAAISAILTAFTFRGSTKGAKIASGIVLGLALVLILIYLSVLIYSAASSGSETQTTAAAALAGSASRIWN